MNVTRTLVANALLALLCSTVTAIAAGAQSPPSTISFDALPRAQRDTQSPPRPKKRVDTVRVVRVDTVRLTRVDTVKVAPAHAATPAAPAAPAAPKVAAPAFAPSSVSGLLQVMLLGGDGALRSTYRIRRAEVKVTSDLGRRIQAIIMVDVAKALALSTTGTQTSVSQNSRVLQDAFVVVPIGRVQLEAGQQRLPLGYEGAMSASSLETIERALMESDKSRGASFGDVRDLGVAARGSWQSLDYRAGVFNGSGETMNDVDKNVDKALVGQLAWRIPVVKGLRVGASAATSGKAKGDKPARDRVGADLKYARGRALLQSEVMVGRDGQLTRQGMYILGGVNVLRSVKVVARFDGWDPDSKREGSPADVTERDYLAGFTLFPPATRLKLHLAVVRKTYSHDITPAATLVLTQLQASW